MRSDTCPEACAVIAAKGLIGIIGRICVRCERFAKDIVRPDEGHFTDCAGIGPVRTNLRTAASPGRHQILNGISETGLPEKMVEAHNLSPPIRLLSS